MRQIAALKTKLGKVNSFRKPEWMLFCNKADTEGFSAICPKNDRVEIRFQEA